jgi:hypothetical protein
MGMAAQQSMWHVNDVVAYDVMRELSSSVQARLLDRARGGDAAARAELLEVRHATLDLDGYDRASVDSYTQQLQRRDAELARADSGAS